jgi:hypothetical protein
MEGPIFSLYAIIYTLCAPLGGLALDRFADQHDVWDALKVAGAMVIVASVTLIVLRQRRARIEGPSSPTPDCLNVSVTSQREVAGSACAGACLRGRAGMTRPGRAWPSRVAE